MNTERLHNKMLQKLVIDVSGEYDTGFVVFAVFICAVNMQSLQQVQYVSLGPRTLPLMVLTQNGKYDWYTLVE